MSWLLMPSLANVIARCYIGTMKRREPGQVIDAPAIGLEGAQGLLKALRSLQTVAELRAFLDDLCTPAELEAIADRWRVVPLLIDELPYRDIHDQTGVSVTTIGRVARCLGQGAGGYRLAAERLGLIPSRGKH